MQEDEGDLEQEAADEEARAAEPKKKTLRPPGYKRPPPGKKQPGPSAPLEEEEEKGAQAEAKEPAAKKPRRTSAEVAAATLPAERTVNVRNSTRQKVQDAEEERKVLEAVSRCGCSPG